MQVRIGGLIVVAIATLRLFGGCSSTSPSRNDAGAGGMPGGAPGAGGAGTGGTGVGGVGIGGAGAGGAGMGGHGVGGEFSNGGHAFGGTIATDAGDDGNDGGPDVASQVDGSGDDGSIDAPAPTLTQIWTTILSVQTPVDTAPACNGCHDGSPGIPDYTSPATTYATWVGVASTSCPPGIRVTPGNAATSVLINKLSAKPNLGLGVTVCGGDPMPLGTDRTITLDQLHMIEDWINAGAPNN